MPVGSPKPQTVATRKYEAKARWKQKSYKVKKKTVEAFAKACDEAGVSQAGKLTEMMNAFVNEVQELKKEEG